MPWKIMEGGKDCPFEVVKEGTGERVACHPTKEKAKAHMAALYANMPMAERGETASISDIMVGQPIIEEREELGTVDNVNFPERIITVRAVPYEQPATVEYRGDIYEETFAQGSLDHLIDRPNRVRVNREHVRRDTVGKVVKFWPGRTDGLIADIRIAKTQLGDDTLGLAADDCLSSSIGFAAMPKWEEVNRTAKTRRINTAHLDHIALTASPAYQNADVLAVREAIARQLDDSQLIDLLTNILVSARPPEQRSTPNLDQYIGDDVFRWADERLNKPPTG